MAAAASTVAKHLRALKLHYPHAQFPLIVSAPMRVFAGPDLAVATSRAGGLGFIGPGVRPADLEPKLQRARTLLGVDTEAGSTLPVGVGFQLFDGDLEVAAAAVAKHRPVAAWLFVPAGGQAEVERWAGRLRGASEGKTRIWVQVGSVGEAEEVTAAESADVLVLQGIDAGGHGLRRGAGVLTLLPEVADRVGGKVPLMGAGGVADGRGVAAVLATGVAAGVVMGTRFLASREAEIAAGFQADVVRVQDGGQTTVRTTLFDRLSGRDDWPARYDGRAIVNASVRDDEAGMAFAENKQRFQAVLKEGGTSGWGEDGRLTSYVGTGVGLVRSVEAAGDIVEDARAQAKAILREAVGNFVE